MSFVKKYQIIFLGDFSLFLNIVNSIHTHIEYLEISLIPQKTYQLKKLWMSQVTIRYDENVD